jgi:phage terminase small subunit
MGARGRKSAAELTTIAAIGPQGVVRVRRPDPPAHLGDDAASLWRATVNGLPADWLLPGGAPVLEAYCSLTVSLRRTLRTLERLETGPREDFEPAEWRVLQRQAAELASRVAMLATKLRLTPQTRMHPRTAGRALARLPEGSPYDYFTE